MEHILHECLTFLDEYEYAGLEQHILDIYQNWTADLVSIHESPSLPRQAEISSFRPRLITFRR